ncbi:transporter substrate-binding domain-containing protein [Aminobacter sp. MSH1]|uniref:transporter substrate-binding domain-containing protein n=1 Tax=Aminobacter sp. MSH1 TaxID=374606 RepID=UPI00131EF8FA|nr:transporter substrate-binding domain-containing protein [Aminobacter sp. MSH1]
MNFAKLFAPFALAFVTSWSMPTVAAHAQSVQDIIDSGKVSIGVLTSAPPLSSTDAEGKDVGYHMDVALKIAEYLGVKAEIIPVTNTSRIAALESKKIDIQVAQSSATPERAKAVMFTIPYGVFKQSVVSLAGTELSGPEDLKGKRVSVPKGGVQDLALQRMNIEGLEIVRFDEEPGAVQALLSGQVDAVAIPDLVALNVIKKFPDQKVEIKFPLFTQSYSIGVRKDAFELHQWLNNTIAYMTLNGELNELHKKWAGGIELPQTLPTF